MSTGTRNLLVAVIGVIGGLIAAILTRLIFNLSAGMADLKRAWVGVGLSALGGMIVIFLTVQLMAQSPPKYPKRTVLTVLCIASAVLGMIASAGLLLIIRFAGDDFFQGQGIIDAILSVLLCGVLALVLFFVAAPVRGFDHSRDTGGAAPERFQVKIKSKTIRRLSRSGD
ncbi:hypothetical protein JXA47_08280 [Candidatus Sumerlaeota bacterium]|nr:hypothetical protein [Candidatus Sumerlaeota bacterium]